jgi:hypothetical protein
MAWLSVAWLSVAWLIEHSQLGSARTLQGRLESKLSPHQIWGRHGRLYKYMYILSRPQRRQLVPWHPWQWPRGTGGTPAVHARTKTIDHVKVDKELSSESRHLELRIIRIVVCNTIETHSSYNHNLWNRIVSRYVQRIKIIIQGISQ